MIAMQQGANRSKRRKCRSLLLGIAPILLVGLCAQATPALADPPNHLANHALDVTGLNRACGAAADSEGDLYASSPGESAIKVLDPEHNLLTTIADANEPCGLAVNSQGDLFVSEQATGKVVRYVPGAYPLSGSPVYGAAESIDSSGDAKGIGVDPFDDRLYVAEGSRVSVYGQDGSFGGIDEVQRVLPHEATGGTFRISFEGEEVVLPWDATHAQVQAGLEGLAKIGAGNVSVGEGDPFWAGRDHIVTFVGTLANTDVKPLDCDSSGLEGPGAGCSDPTNTDGFSGHLGEGDLTSAVGVAPYTYKVNSLAVDRYLFVADASGGVVKIFGGPEIRALKLHRTLEGPKAGEDFGFGPKGAYLAADPGNEGGESKCNAIAEQACTAGHFLVYDSAHEALDEFEADGEFLDQVKQPGALADAEPSALAVDRSGGPGDGTIYLGAGNGAGAELLAFAPLATPNRKPLPALSHVLQHAEAVATDSHGDVYVAAEKKIYVYGPSGEELSNFEDAKLGALKDLAVDSTGRLYVLENREQVAYYTPAAYPPVAGTTYARGPVVASYGSFSERPAGCVSPECQLVALAVNPANDHVLVGAEILDFSQVIELDSAAPGHDSALLVPDFGGDLGFGALKELAVYGASGDVYLNASRNSASGIFVVNPAGDEVLARIGGTGSVAGPWGTFNSTLNFDVDQSNGHVLLMGSGRTAIEEFDASGGFVGEFFDPGSGEFQGLSEVARRLAVDNGAFSPHGGSVYLAYDELQNGTPDLWAFAPLSYGEAPVVATGAVDGLGAGNATLHGTVDPRGFDLAACRVEYLPASQYDSNGQTFTGATVVPCDQSLAEIGKGTGPVAVDAEVSGLDPAARYRFRLTAQNKYGEDAGDAALFGPPAASTSNGQPVLYDEATLRGEIETSGLPTEYRFEYGPTTSYGQSTPALDLAPGEEGVSVEVPLNGLQEGASYHFRLVAENEAGTAAGEDRAFTTLQRRSAESCPNPEFRTGLSANLPDCRAYELVTPAETHGLRPGSPSSSSTDRDANNWLVDPRGPGAGESLAFFTVGTLPGFEGNGLVDGYRAARGAGPHPQGGWSTELSGPSYQQTGGKEPKQRGVAADQRYFLWNLADGSLGSGEFLRTPSGFEPVGIGSLGADPEAESRTLSADGRHVVFASSAHLEEAAPPAGTEALYDRAAGAPSAEVVSVRPDGSAFAAGEAATYRGTVQDAGPEEGGAIAFSVAGALYLHRDGKTFAVAGAPNTFAGISADGTRVFYASIVAPAIGAVPPASLFVCDTEAGSCAGPEATQEATKIADNAVFVNVSDDGSRVFYASAGDLYRWDAADGEARLVAALDPADFVGFGSSGAVRLDSWVQAVGYGGMSGRAKSPTRNTPDGGALVFQSHAQLSDYDNEGLAEIYRYSPDAAAGEGLLCVSCDPSGAPPTTTAATLQTPQENGTDPPVKETNLIDNVTSDGEAVFFQSGDRLLPEDANDAQDVYEWKANGAPGCQRPGGCLGLISSGQGEEDSDLFGMSADGHDVFFTTREKLVGQDVAGSPSIYDARVGGGIPDRPAAAPCEGDACQGSGSTPPVISSPASATIKSQGNTKGKEASSCAKSQRKVRKGGNTRCVAKKHHKRKSNHKRHRKANHDRRASR